MIKTELIRGFKSRTFIITCLLAFVAIVTSAYMENPYYFKTLIREGFDIKYTENFFNVFDTFFRTQHGIFSLVIILLVTLPYADAYVLDKKTNMLRSILARTERVKYVVAKGITAGATGALVIGGTYIVFFLLLHFLPLARGLCLNLERCGFITVTDGLFLGSIYETSPYLYIFLLILLSMLFGAVYAVFGLSLSTVFQNRYYAIAMPFVVFFVWNSITQMFRFPHWSPLSALLPNWIRDLTYWHVFSSLIIISIVSVLLLFVHFSRKDIAE